MKRQLLVFIIIFGLVIPPSYGSLLQDTGEFFANVGKRITFQDRSTHGCDAVGLQPFQKKLIADDYECAPDNLTNEKVQELLEVQMAIAHRVSNVEFQKDAVLIALSEDYGKNLAKKQSYMNNLQKDFEKLSAGKQVGINSEAPQFIQKAAEAIEKLLIPAVLAHKSNSKIDLDTMFTYAAGMSPLISFVKDDLKKMILDSSKKPNANPVNPDDFNFESISKLLHTASSKASQHIITEVSDVENFTKAMKIDPSSRGFFEKRSFQKEKDKYTEKFIINNPIQASQVIDGIKITTEGTTFEPTKYVALTRGLCELESKHFEKGATDQLDFFIAGAALAPLSLIGGVAGGVCMAGFAAYNLAIKVPAAFNKCVQLKKDFESQNALALNEALHTPVSEMGNPPTVAQAQAIALSECTANAGIETGFAVLSAALAGFGLAGATKSFESFAKAGLISSKVALGLSKATPIMQQTALWGGRAMGGISIGFATKEYVEACYGSSVDEERCRVAKLSLAMTGITVVGTEANRRFLAKEAQKKAKLKEIDEKNAAELEKKKRLELAQLRKSGSQNPEEQRYVTDMRVQKGTDGQKRYLEYEPEFKNEAFKKLQKGDEIKFFDPKTKKEQSLVYLGQDGGGRKVFLPNPKDPASKMIAIADESQFAQATGGPKAPIFQGKVQNPSTDARRLSVFAPPSGDYITVIGSNGRQNASFPVRVEYPDPSQPRNQLEAIIVGRVKIPLAGGGEADGLRMILPNGSSKIVPVGLVGADGVSAKTPFLTIPAAPPH